MPTTHPFTFQFPLALCVETLQAYIRSFIRSTNVRAPGAAADEPRADPEALPRALQETPFTSFPWPQARPAEPRTWVTAGRIPPKPAPKLLIITE